MISASSTDMATFTLRLLGSSSATGDATAVRRSEEHTSELQSQSNLVCRLLLEKKKHSPPRYPRSVPRESIDEPAPETCDDFQAATADADATRYFGHLRTRGALPGTDHTER